MASVQAEPELRVVAARVDALGGLRLAHLGHEHFLGDAPFLRTRINRCGLDGVKAHVEQVAAGESVRRHGNAAQRLRHTVGVWQMEPQDLLLHGRVGTPVNREYQTRLTQQCTGSRKIIRPSVARENIQDRQRRALSAFIARHSHAHSSRINREDGKCRKSLGQFGPK